MEGSKRRKNMQSNKFTKVDSQPRDANDEFAVGVDVEIYD
jgi:hypothetical protein